VIHPGTFGTSFSNNLGYDYVLHLQKKTRFLKNSNFSFFSLKSGILRSAVSFLKRPRKAITNDGHPRYRLFESLPCHHFCHLVVSVVAVAVVAVAVAVVAFSPEVQLQQLSPQQQ
jgi:hypothetical protein